MLSGFDVSITTRHLSSSPAILHPGSSFLSLTIQMTILGLRIPLKHYCKLLLYDAKVQTSSIAPKRPMAGKNILLVLRVSVIANECKTPECSTINSIHPVLIESITTIFSQFDSSTHHPLPHRTLGSFNFEWLVSTPSNDLFWSCALLQIVHSRRHWHGNVINLEPLLRTIGTDLLTTSDEFGSTTRKPIS